VYKRRARNIMPRGLLVAVDHIGGEPLVVREQVLSEKHTIRFVFHDFEELNHKRGKSTKSSASLCHGYQWGLELYPGGVCQSSSNNIYLSLTLHCVSTKGNNACEVRAKYAFRVSSVTSVAKEYRSLAKIFDKRKGGWGRKNYIRRDCVLDPSEGFLVDGNLTIEVDIQVYKEESPFWEPKKTLHLDMMTILESTKESGDVKFQVGPDEFSANLNILQVRAPVLAALTEGCSPDTPIRIQGVRPFAFRSLLHFVYTDDVPKVDEFQKEARELIDVANRFGCKGLKLAAEAELAASGISVDTAADMVLLGDANNCCLS
jgi:speckle-type POZ protein